MGKMNRFKPLALMAATLVLIGQSPIVFAQAETTKAPEAGKPAEPAKTEKDKAQEDFEKSIKDHKKQEGLFNVYTKGEAVQFEIPKDKFGRDLLIYSALKESPEGSYSGAAGNRGVVRFELRGDKVLLRLISFENRAEGDLAQAVRISNVQPIVAAFDVKGTSAAGGTLIDMSRTLKSEIPELSVRFVMGGGNPDANRTFVERVTAFPENINIEMLMTFVGGGNNQLGPLAALLGLPSRNTNTGLIHTSIVLLPEDPMMGRYYDARVGYFNYPFTQFRNEQSGTKPRSYIARYRLEKKDPKAELSEPVKPIIYYISQEVPAKWRDYVKKGIEDWQPAFESAGFKNAIIAKMAPTKEEDPNWSPEDVRYSVVRWAALPIANAMGPHTADPRSGEILSAHIIMWHDILKLNQGWYFTQASPSDPRGRRLPMPDDLQGELLRFVVAHEVGHTLGLPHNGKGSAMVPVAWLRDPKWTSENGTATSIMDYARFNYVAQPGDGAYLMPKLGIYDKFSIKWGYAPLNARTPDDEVRTLDTWAAAQVTNPLLRFYDNFNSADPTALAESLGDDPVQASSYGVANLKRVMEYLVPATTKLGEDYSLLAEMHSEVVGQFGLYISHVGTVVGGVVETNYHSGRGGEVYVPVPKAQQWSAVQWLIKNVLDTPHWLMRRDVVTRLTNGGPGARLLQLQNQALNSLLNNARMGRMLANESMNGANAYTLRQMMDDLRGAVWAELQLNRPVVDGYRRALQRSYVQNLIGKIPSYTADQRAYATWDLSLQYAAIQGALPKVTDEVTKAHLSDLGRMIDLALKFPPTTAAPAPNPFEFLFGIEDGDQPLHRGCGHCLATARVRALGK